MALHELCVFVLTFIANDILMLRMRVRQRRHYLSLDFVDKQKLNTNKYIDEYHCCSSNCTARRKNTQTSEEKRRIFWFNEIFHQFCDDVSDTEDGIFMVTPKNQTIIRFIVDAINR